MNNTPTPTDPRDREILQLRAYLDEIGMAALGAQPESPTGPGVLKVVQALKADHSKLAAEIARMLASNGQFRSDVLFAIAGTREQLPDEQIIKTAKSVAAEIAELKAGLELTLDELVWTRREPATGRLFCAVCEEFVPDHRPTCLVHKAEQIFSGTAPSLIDNLKRELEAARKELFESQMANGELLIELQHCPTCAKNIKQRDTALAAKAELLALLRHAQFYVDLYGPRDLFDRIERATDPSINDSASEQSADRERTEADDFAGQANAGAVALTPAPTQEPPAGGGNLNL